MTSDTFVKVKRIHPNAKLPNKLKIKNDSIPLFSLNKQTFMPCETWSVRTGIGLIPYRKVNSNKVPMVNFEISFSLFKKGLMLCFVEIDSDDEVIFVVYNKTNDTITLNKNSHVANGIFEIKTEKF